MQWYFTTLQLLNSFGVSEGAIKKEDNYVKTTVEDKYSFFLTIWEQTKDAKNEKKNNNNS